MKSLFFEKIENKKKEDLIIKKEMLSDKELLDDCLDYFIKSKPKELQYVQQGIRSKEKFLEEVRYYLRSKSIDKIQLKTVEKMFERFVWGYHLLDDLIRKGTISDIKTIRKDIIRVKEKGERYTSNVKFETDEELDKFIRIIAIKNEINLSDINAMQSFTDKNTYDDFILRINISTKYINSCNHSYLHIRIIPKKKYSLDQVLEVGLATEEQLNYLINKVKNGESIILTGAGGSGKTTMMNILIDQIPHNKSGLVIQENEELFSDTHPDLMFQRIRTAKGESKVQYDLKDLSINGLLIDLDYFVIGEIKGGEAKYLLNASYTGHTCLAGVHGESSTEAIDKLIDYAKYESDYSREDLMKMLKNIKTIVFMKGFNIAEIAEVVEYDYSKKELIYKKIFE